jgi:hypothetical protein
MSTILDPGTLLLVALAALIISGALAPLETLGWWAGWYGDPPNRSNLDPKRASDEEDDLTDEAISPPRPDIDPWVIFLTGVHAVGHVSYIRNETLLVQELRRAFPRGRVVEVFPYSVTQRPLSGDRTFSRAWRLAQGWKLSRRRSAQMVSFIINIRNIWQVLVSADRRYGPIYNLGKAELILRTLRRRGLPERSNAHIVLIGYSGGAQIAAGAAPFIKRESGARVSVLSLGGMISAEPGLLDTDHIVHLRGGRDRVERLVHAMFPGRWRALPWSPWNVARRRGTLRELTLGDVEHTGARSYFDAQHQAQDGRSYLAVTCAALVALIRDPEAPL